MGLLMFTFREVAAVRMLMYSAMDACSRNAYPAVCGPKHGPPWHLPPTKQMHDIYLAYSMGWAVFFVVVTMSSCRGRGRSSWRS